MFGGEYEKKDMEFKPIPKGRYACILDNCCIEATPNTGTKFLKMDCTIVKGDFSNRKLFHKIWFTDKSYDMAAQQLDNMGVFSDIKPTASIEDFMLSAAEAVFKLLGKHINVSVTGHKEWEGKKYENTFVVSDEETVQVKAATDAGVDATEEIAF